MRKIIIICVCALASLIMFYACDTNAKDATESKKESYELYACGLNPLETRSAPKTISYLFSGDDILWFDTNSREIKFKEMVEPLNKRLLPFQEIEFYLGDKTLFVVSSFVVPWDSRVFDNLVLCYGCQNPFEVNENYYLYDCYPYQFSDSEQVKANRKKNADSWDLFIKYLESKNKLKK